VNEGAKLLPVIGWSLQTNLKGSAEHAETKNGISCVGAGPSDYPA
jgi:hypothetical protein